MEPGGLLASSLLVNPCVYLVERSILPDDGSDKTHGFISKQLLDQTDPGQGHSAAQASSLPTYLSEVFTSSREKQNLAGVQRAESAGGGGNLMSHFTKHRRGETVLIETTAEGLRLYSLRPPVALKAARFAPFYIRVNDLGVPPNQVTSCPTYSPGTARITMISS